MIGTTEQLTAEEEVDKGGVLARYAELIGIDEARYPDFDEFPDQLTLPPEVIGDYIGSILATEGDGIERRQLILWRNQSFAHGKVGKGIRNASGSPTLMKDKARAFLGRKAFLFYHAHPETTAEEIKDGFAPEENKDFSIGDIGFMRLFPRMAYIFGVGKKDGGTFAFQTSESKHLPLSSVWGYVRTYIDSIFKIFQISFSHAMETFKETGVFETNISEEESREEFERWFRISQGAHYLTQLGFACYEWDPPEDFDWDNPEQSITLKKVIPAQEQN